MGVTNIVGAKMVLIDIYTVPVPASLLVIATLIGGAVLLSLRAKVSSPDGVLEAAQPHAHAR